MTKDLALCIYNSNDVPKDKYCETFEFIEKVAQTLKSKIVNAKLWMILHVDTYWIYLICILIGLKLVIEKSSKKKYLYWSLSIKNKMIRLKLKWSAKDFLLSLFIVSKFNI